MFSKTTSRHIETYLLQQKLEIENLLITLKRIHNSTEDLVNRTEYESLLAEYEQKHEDIKGDILLLRSIQTGQ
jgi:hypothetical protein